MAQVINTNVLSLVTQNNLNRSQGVLGTAIERLSSGARINSAKDDAAGQAIANRFTANVKGLAQASRNANDGISIAQTAEGAVNEINDNIQRIRELTVQAKNGTNSKSDIGSIQEEVNERLSEIKRISEQTQFNGIKVLEQGTKMNFQVGANDGEIIELDMQKIDLDKLGLKDFELPTYTALKSDTKLTDPQALALAKKTDAGFTSTEVDGHELFETESGSYVAAKGGKYYEVKGFEAKGTSAADKVVGKLVVGTEELTDIKTKADADAVNSATTKKLDDALKTVDSYRSKLGAFQNRMQSTINNLNNSVNNLSAARSRIQDADFATEVSNMSRGQILQQAGTAVLAQANQVPQGVLSLLR
ncbi:TPA: FliC/FljB family flagellin [Morganella morganii]|uniref:FliC/FljB family flagellin n=1 Tax=Morganella morganii TaxID=582 RepID=UPI001BD9B24E|nr:FliC/FljB family flagellin [Morganella morganii]EKT0591440.1 FliC/FljB family flagellin [Morganella morganii]EKU0269296.1 FliC/FljB family flagellin [Morganella morganii]ELF0883377.1 FliC/FljB family flagellin [Morganella morganii]MBT0388157.1 FliC/FljB family flagellin [Morganella morganii subsp. morganii]HCR3195322.1 FliC/FljB family flagellin [Morganella morganii]